jgi:hypothetical protein
VAEAGERELGRPGAAADFRRALDQMHRAAGASELDRRPQPVGSGADDDRVRGPAHPRPAIPVSGYHAPLNATEFKAFLAESAKVFDGSGPYYTGVKTSAVSGRSATVINKPPPSLYIWSATNVYFQEKPSRGVIAVLPSPNQQVNGATSCEVVKSATYAFGVHCDLYSNRFPA